MIRGFVSGLLALAATLVVAHECASVTVIAVDFLAERGLAINAAGPLLLQMDPDRNRLIVANTLTSSLSVIDGKTHAIENIPIAGRAFQHLKAECLTRSRRTGAVYLVGQDCFHIVDPESGSSKIVPTVAQFESIAVDEETGNVFLAGRESASLGFYDAARGELSGIPWLEWSEPLINLNATPPPPIRKVVADPMLGRIVAVDGFTSTLHLFDASTGTLVSSRRLGLSSGARWHLAGYDEQDHALYLVIESDERKVIEAARIDVIGTEDTVVPLPEFTEGVGILFNPVREEVYIPYDNHPSVHVVDFRGGGVVDEIRVPAYGNDASALDAANDRLYIASWAHGEVDVVDLKTRRLEKRITDLGILPHMFTMAFNPDRNLLYFPKGATAVNGTFGAAVTALDPASERVEKIYTGWPPVDLVELPDRGSFLVFGSEDEFAEVRADGSCELHQLPFDYPIRAIRNRASDVYLSYGPHQSYWPVVYIWGAKNGLLTIDRHDLSFYDRRIPRQAHELALDADGALYFTQNNWGREEQFLGVLEDGVRMFDANRRIALGDTVSREITQRILGYDPELHRLYLVRIGEGDEDPSILQVIDPRAQKVIQRVELGLTATDLIFDPRRIYVANFDSKNVSVIDKSSFTVTTISAGEGPLRLCRLGDEVYVIDHVGNALEQVVDRRRTYEIPWEGMPDNLLRWNDRLVLTSHNAEELLIIQFDPEVRNFSLLHREAYPFGDTRFDSGNVSFYVRGQFGDGVFTLTRGEADRRGRLWLTDFLSGKLFIFSRE